MIGISSFEPPPRKPIAGVRFRFEFTSGQEPKIYVVDTVRFWRQNEKLSSNRRMGGLSCIVLASVRIDRMRITAAVVQSAKKQIEAAEAWRSIHGNNLVRLKQYELAVVEYEQGAGRNSQGRRLRDRQRGIYTLEFNERSDAAQAEDRQRNQRPAKKPAKRFRQDQARGNARCTSTVAASRLPASRQARRRQSEGS